MNVEDLLREPTLMLRLMTPSSTDLLQRPITWCAPTELMHPAPLLSNDCLMLTSGIGMAFTDERTWDAYVERLAVVPIAALAFAVGTAHQELPLGLVKACTAHDLPLLEIPSTVPPLQVGRHVDSWLRRERLEAEQHAWDLADECARLANDDADLETLLSVVEHGIGAPVAIYDAFGSVVAQYPSNVRWPHREGAADSQAIDLVALPMGVEQPCHLAVAANRGSGQLAVLAPVASVLALQLKRALSANMERHRALVSLLDECVDWEYGDRNEIQRLILALGIDRTEDLAIMVADVAGERAAQSWQFRLALHDSFELVVTTEHEHRLIALCQRWRDDRAAVRERILSIAPKHPLVLRETIGDIEAMRLSIVHALDVFVHAQGPTLAPALGLTAVVAATAGRGARVEAERLFAPLMTPESQRAQLLETLRAHLRNDAQPSRTCAELFIHRNTLGYRIRRIEELLGIDLRTIEAQAMCHIGLRLVDVEPY